MAALTDAVKTKRNIPAGAELPAWLAVWNALRSEKLDFYPCVVVEGTPTNLDSDQCITDALGASKSWRSVDSDPAAIDGAIKLARESLTEVTKQTLEVVYDEV